MTTAVLNKEHAVPTLSRRYIYFLFRQVDERARSERIQDPNASETHLLEFFERKELCYISAVRSIVDD